MRALDGVGHGTLLVGRYRLEERVRTGPDGSLWRAVDETLDRQVSVRVVRPGHRYTADVVDAARRAALVEDPRLARVLDVGESGGSAFIVGELLPGTPLGELIAAGPLHPETVRRLVGEAAEALDRASARGLHHLALTPASLVIAPDGAVTVLGTAVDAALAGIDQDDDPLGADRSDVVGLVRVLYAGLTGRWPGPVDGPLGPVPGAATRPAPPGEVVDGVPRDLDDLCRLTLGGNAEEGPRSPGDLAGRLAPWAPAQPAVEEPDPSPAGPPATPGRSPRPAGPLEALAALAAEGWTPGGATDADPAPHSDPAPTPASVGVATSKAPAGRPTRITIGSGLRAPADAGSTAPPAGWSSGGLTTGGHPVSHADGMDDWSLLARNAPVTQVEPDDSQPLGPFLPPAPVTRPPRDQARFVLAVVAGLVTVGLILAAFSLRGLFKAPAPLVEEGPIVPTATASVSGAASGGSASSAGAAPVPTPATPSATGVPSASAVPTPSGTPAEISGIQALDPQGDGDENGSTADRAIDGDPSTTWRSARYNTASFGGLKQGLGLYLQLTGDTVKSVTISMTGSGGNVELRTAKGPGLDSSVVVATAQPSGGTVVLTPAQPVPAQSLLLWFTELPRQDNGEYRLVVSEIAVS